MLSWGDGRSMPLSGCSRACRSTLPEAGIRLSYDGRGGVGCKVLSSVHGHVMVSPAVGQNHIEKEPLKQCLKNTWRQVQRTRHCLSFRALRMRSAGVGDKGTSSLSHIHLQMGRGEGS